MAALSKIHAHVLARGGFRRGEMVVLSGVGRRTEYGWEGPNMPDKGKRGGSCNRTACQRPGAFWWNRGSYSWYCTACAHMLNRANRDDEFCKDEPLCSLDEEAEREYDERMRA